MCGEATGMPGEGEMEVGRDTIGVESGGVKWKGDPRGRGICIHLVGSFHCTAETNTIIKQLYSKKIFLIK